MKQYDKLLGVLGGMGPEATVYFLGKIVEVTYAEEDQDHIPVIVYNYPQIPDRVAAYFGRGESPLPFLLAGVKKLQEAGADFVAIPCNSSHLWIDELASESKANILNLVEITIREIPNDSRIGLMATTATVESELYALPLRKKGVDVLFPDNQDFMMDQIRKVKSGDVEKARMNMLSIVRELVERGSTHILAGCTEVPVAIGNDELPVPLLDPMEIMAVECVRKIGGKLRKV